MGACEVGMLIVVGTIGTVDSKPLPGSGSIGRWLATFMMVTVL